MGAEGVLLRSPYILGEVAQKMGLDISISPQYSGFFARKWAEWRHHQSSADISFLHVPNLLLGRPLILISNGNNRYTLTTKDGQEILQGVVGEIISKRYQSDTVTIRVKHLNAESGEKLRVVKIPLTSISDSLSAFLSVKEMLDGAGMGTGILRISYMASSPEKAQVILNHVLDTAVLKNAKHKFEQIEKTLQFINQQIPLVSHKLSAMQDKLNQFGLKTGVFNAVTEEGQLESQMFTLQEDLEKAQFQKTLLLKDYTSLHPMVIAQTSQVQELKKELHHIEKKMNSMPFYMQKEGGIENDIKVQQRIYEGMFAEMEQVEMEKAGVDSAIQVLSTASYPVSQIPIRTFAISFGSALIGLMIALCYLFLKHALAPVVEDPNVIERKLGISVMGILPFSQKQRVCDLMFKRGSDSVATKPFLLARDNSKDLSIEALRSLRTSVQILMFNAKDNVISITGCSPGIGKSFVSANFAFLLSELDKRVLLIDADLRLGKQNYSLGVSKIPGLSTFLTKNADAKQIIQKTDIPNLDIVATGLYPEGPSELLSSKKFGEFIAAARKDYDIVLIDTPPILAVTDAALILPYAAVNLMVLGIGKDQVKEVEHAVGILEKSGISIHGIVFNTIKYVKSGFGYDYSYGKYNYNYSYGKQ